MKIKIFLLSFFCFSALNAQQPPADMPTNIAEKFKGKGGMSSQDPINLDTFDELAADSTETEPFFLIAIPAGATYYFYDSKELDKFWKKAVDDTGLIDPSNRGPIERYYVFKYNKKSSNGTEFPFDYSETITKEQLARRFSVRPVDESVEVWMRRMRELDAAWAIGKLTQRSFLRIPTQEDLRQVYPILGLPVNEGLIQQHYPRNLNRLNRYLLDRSERRYTDRQLQKFLTDAGFPLEADQLRQHYYFRAQGIALINRDSSRTEIDHLY